MNYQSKLSASGKLAVVIGLAYLPVSAFAAHMEAIGNTQVSQHNNVDVINIVKPNEHGLSHNQYNQFNVGRAGAVFNNATSAGQSQLAGSLPANSQLYQQAAKVILNEVVSKNPSLILGQQEVFGMAADYVLANPNGITYNGGSIINAPRASLVVGKPELANGQLHHFDTSNNPKALTVNGQLDKVSILDLIAPKVIVNADAKLTANQAINVVSGSNKVSYADGKIEKVHSPHHSPVLDGSIYGSMKAGSIRIHATDERATQEIKQANITAAQDLSTHVAGSLNVNAAKLNATDMQLNAAHTVIEGIKKQHGSSTPNTQTGKLERNVWFVKQNSAQTESFDRSEINAKNQLVFNNTHDINIIGANIHAGSLQIQANNLHANSTITTDKNFDSYRRSKLSWHNQATSASQNQTVHRTEMDVAGNAVIHTNQKLHLTGTALKVGENLMLSGTQGIHLSGNVATSQSEDGLDVRNETAKLRTGTGAKAESNQTFTATEIQVGSHLGIQTDNLLNTSGAKISTNGNTIVSAEKVNLATATTANSKAVHDQFKFWGGIGGGYEDGTTRTQENLHGTSLTSKGLLFIGAKNGLTVSGSVVKGDKGAAVTSGAGNLHIKQARTTSSESVTNRVGTIFNITKSSLKKHTDKEVVTGSTLASDTNLQLASDKDIAILGSSLKAMGSLGVSSTGNINIAAAAAHTHSQTNESSNKGFSEQASKLSSTPDSKIAEATAGVGIRFEQSQSKTHATEHVSSQLSAKNIDLNTKKNTNIAGSQIDANGALNIHAQNVTTAAALDSNHTISKQNTTDIGLKVQAGVSQFNPKAGVTIGIDSQSTHTQNHNAVAQAAKLSGNVVNIHAQNNIKHQGSQINSATQINQHANNISQTAAENINHTTQITKAGGVNLNYTAAQSSGLSITAGVYGKGGKDEKMTTTAVAGSLNAGGNVNLTAQNIQDTGTHYQSGNQVNITANQYTNQAATNHSSHISNQGGGVLSLSANTKDFTNLNVGLSAKGNYAHENTQTSQASLGNINAGSLNIQTVQDTNLATNIHTTNHTQISSQKGNVNFNQSHNTSNSTVASADAGLTLGAKVNVSGAILPKVGVNADVKHHQSHSSTGVANNIHAGGNMQITANKEINVHGSNINSNASIDLNATNVNSQALSHSSNQKGVGIGGKITLGANDSGVVDSLGTGAHLDIVNETASSHTANQITANQGAVNIHATGTQGITLTGTQIAANHVALQAEQGNVHLNSATGSLKKGSGGAGFDLNGGVSPTKFTPASGSAYLNVDVANNNTHTSSSINADSAHIDAAKDVHLHSSSINANKLDGQVGGNLNLHAAQNITNQVNVGLSAAGGKGIDPKTLLNKDKELDGKKVGQTILSDLQNNTVLGHNVQVQANLDVNQTQATQAANINAHEMNLNVAGTTNLHAAQITFEQGTGVGNAKVVDSGSNHDSSNTLNAGVNVSTNVPKMVELGIQHLSTGSSPIYRGKAVRVGRFRVGSYYSRR